MSINKLHPFPIKMSIPAVYDDSMSYYEFLAKMAARVNEVIESQNGLVISVQELYNWFNNLDLTQEVSDKLDDMYENGELGELVAQLVADKADKSTVMAQELRIDGLETTKADKSALVTEHLRINDLEATKADQSDLNIQSSRIDTLSEQKASQEDLNTQTARITNLAQLTNGSTTGDAELIDGRTGADGTVYTSIGQAIRTQIFNVVKFATLYSYYDWYIDTQTGKLVHEGSFYLLPVDGTGLKDITNPNPDISFDLSRPYETQYLFVNAANTLKIAIGFINEPCKYLIGMWHGTTYTPCVNFNVKSEYCFLPKIYYYNDYQPIYIWNIAKGDVSSSDIVTNAPLHGGYVNPGELSSLKVKGTIVSINKTAVVPKTLSKKVLVIGDSITAAGIWLQKLKELQPGLIFYGSCTTDLNSIHYEGWRGAAFDSISTMATNPITQAANDLSYSGSFNFSEYITKHPVFADVDAVIIALGVNDRRAETVSYAAPMINSIKAYNANIKVFNLLCPPGTSSQLGFAAGNSGSTTAWKDEKLDIYNHLYKINGDWCIPAYYTTNPFYDYPQAEMRVDPLNPATETGPNNDVHPNQYGCEKIAYMTNCVMMYKL